jgi:CheY-like chemotaxis protein
MVELKADIGVQAKTALKAYVMVVDKNPKVREETRAILESAGFGVITAKNQEEAFEAIHTGNNPLIIEMIALNFDQPDALATVSYFKSQFPSIPLIGATGGADLEGRAAQKVTLTILGGGKGGSALLSLFSRLPEVEILGIADRDPDAPALKEARKLGIPVTNDVTSLIAREDADLIVDVTGDPAMEQLIVERKRARTDILGGAAARLLWDVVQYEIRMHTQLAQTERLAAMVRDGILADYLVRPIEAENLIHSVAKSLDKRKAHGAE